MTARDAAPIVEVEGLCKTFPGQAGAGPVTALSSVSLSIREGETLGLVGESGSGKSTLARVLVGLLEPDAGELRVRGASTRGLTRGGWRAVRRSVQMVFQDPSGSLNPRMTVGEALARPVVLNDPQRSPRDRVVELLGLVGLRPEHAARYPHELSGGQQQRVGIARALASRPAVVVLDEPTSALDVSIQAQILALLKSLQSTLGLTYLFISHNLSVVRHLSDRVAVMYRGHLLEVGDAAGLIDRPVHPYTRLLLGSVPRFYGRTVEPEHPSAAWTGTAAGCPFVPRCARRTDRCAREMPALRADPPDTRQAACFNPYR